MRRAMAPLRGLPLDMDADDGGPDEPLPQLWAPESCLAVLFEVRRTAGRAPCDKRQRQRAPMPAKRHSGIEASALRNVPQRSYWFIVVQGLGRLQPSSCFGWSLRTDLNAT